jgi:serine protease Do
MSDAEGGARVDSLDPKSPAAEGLHIGDVVVEVDRTPVHGAAEATLRLTHAAHTSLVRIRRDGSFLYLGLDLD